MQKLSSDRWLSLLVFAFALVLLFVWIPLDTETGLLEKLRRRVLIGDALGPTVAGCVLLLGAVLTWLRPDPRAPRLRSENLRWIAALTLVFALSLALMRHLGPLVGSLTDTGYRPLRNTLPWKYIGYITGGTLMVAALSGMAQPAQKRRLWALLLTGFCAATLIALAYDLPFEDLLLPPNGDL